jgi:bifunctional non-homologous end joining protein LigD
MQIEVAGKQLEISNLSKILYPAADFTKGQVIDYYSRIAPVLLPHLKDRYLTLKRYPEGVEGDYFYEKNCPSHRPAWVATAPVPSERRGVIDFCLANDLPTLVWVANLASLELHTSLALRHDPGRPTVLVFDLDPGEPADIIDCARVALQLKELFTSGLGLRAFPKTSGSKGLQVYVPLNTPVDYEQTKRYARTVAGYLEKRAPKEVTSNMRKDLRRGKVFIDWSQNDAHKTTVCVYSLRARAKPTVSTPLAWGEVEDAVRTDDADKLRFVAGDVLDRVRQWGDLFAPVLKIQQTLPQIQ